MSNHIVFSVLPFLSSETDLNVLDFELSGHIMAHYNMCIEAVKFFKILINFSNSVSNTAKM